MESQKHPVVAAAAALEAALKDVADVNPAFMATREKKSALLRWTGWPRKWKSCGCG